MPLERLGSQSRHWNELSRHRRAGTEIDLATASGKRQFAFNRVAAGVLAQWIEQWFDLQIHQARVTQLKDRPTGRRCKALQAFLANIPDRRLEATPNSAPTTSETMSSRSGFANDAVVRFCSGPVLGATEAWCSE